MREETIKIYQFDELSDEAKERARDWYREDLSAEINMLQEDSCYMLKEKFGIVAERVYWTDPYSQGFHATIEKGAYFEDDDALLKKVLDDSLYTLLNDFNYSLSISRIQIQHHGGQNMSNYIDVDLDFYYHDEDDEEYDKEEFKALSNLQDDIEELVNDYLKDEVIGWLEGHIRRGMDSYFLEDEHVDETIRINEYEFTENGRRY